MASTSDFNTVDKSWIGGFAESKSAFAYPKPNLKSLPMLDNMANIPLLQRQQQVKWPEFSWETEVGVSESRCYTMFSPFISRIGYDRTGRVYSIICPQQGMWLGDKVCINIEVTVTGQRGWVDESNKSLAADMTVEAKIWLSPEQGEVGKMLWLLLQTFDKEFPLPIDKKHAIRVVTHKPGDADEPIFPLRDGESKPELFPIPSFAKHPEAWAVANLGVQIGEITKTHHPLVDEFNELLMKAFNVSSGNMLQTGNTLFWNVWFTAPEVVNQEEWQNHADKWRKSIQAHHGSPGGAGTAPRFFNGDPFEAKKDLSEEIGKELLAFLTKHKVGDFKEEVEDKAKELLGNNEQELKKISQKAKGFFSDLFDKE